MTDNNTVLLEKRGGALWITIRDVCVRLLTRPSQDIETHTPQQEPPAVATPVEQTV